MSWSPLLKAHVSSPQLFHNFAMNGNTLGEILFAGSPATFTGKGNLQPGLRAPQIRNKLLYTPMKLRNVDKSLHVDSQKQLGGTWIKTRGVRLADLEREWAAGGRAG